MKPWQVMFKTWSSTMILSAVLLQICRLWDRTTIARRMFTRIEGERCSFRDLAQTSWVPIIRKHDQYIAWGTVISRGWIQ